jgi:ribonuclease HI
MDSVVRLYTDGACKGNPGVGGWGALLRLGETEKELYGGEADTTNNRMELMAVIQGLNALKRSCVVEVWLDSEYVKNGITQWMANWKRRGWKTADKKPVKNAELWRELDAAAQRHTVTWHWVRGHTGHEGNERADALANRGVEQVRAAQRMEAR